MGVNMTNTKDLTPFSFPPPCQRIFGVETFIGLFYYAAVYENAMESSLTSWSSYLSFNNNVNY